MPDLAIFRRVVRVLPLSTYLRAGVPQSGPLLTLRFVIPFPLWANLQARGRVVDDGELVGRWVAFEDSFSLIEQQISDVEVRG